MMSEEKLGVCFSIQSSYLTYITSSGVLVCDNIINVPTAKAVTKQNTINNATYQAIPVVELIMPNVGISIKLLTNEGITVNPVSQSAVTNPVWAYHSPRVYFVLPIGTTEVKKVFVDTNENLTCALDFAVMPEPYNYEGGLFAVAGLHINYALGLISNLDGRVDALLATLQKLTFLSARGKVITTENYNIGKDGFVRITNNPRFIRGTLKHNNTNPWRVDFYFSDHEENTLKTRVYIPAGSSVLLLDLITGQLCITTTNNTDVSSVTYSLPLLPNTRDIPVNLSWVVPTQGNLNMEVQLWA